MNRRQFLAWLSGTAAGVAAAPYLDLDQLLWVPKPIIVVPAMPGGNYLVTPEWITKEALRVLENNLAFMKDIDRFYDAAWPVGNMINIPARRISA